MPVESINGTHLYIGTRGALENWQGRGGRAGGITVPTLVIYGKAGG
jgi:hypothetical protein